MTYDVTHIFALLLGLFFGAYGLGSFIAGVVAAQRPSVLAVQYLWSTVLLGAAILLVDYAFGG